VAVHARHGVVEQGGPGGRGVGGRLYQHRLRGHELPHEVGEAVDLLHGDAQHGGLVSIARAPLRQLRNRRRLRVGQQGDAGRGGIRGESEHVVQLRVGGARLQRQCPREIGLLGIDGRERRQGAEIGNDLTHLSKPRDLTEDPQGIETPPEHVAGGTKLDSEESRGARVTFVGGGRGLVRDVIEERRDPGAHTLGILVRLRHHLAAGGDPRHELAQDVHRREECVDDDGRRGPYPSAELIEEALQHVREARHLAEAHHRAAALQAVREPEEQRDGPGIARSLFQAKERRLELGDALRRFLDKKRAEVLVRGFRRAHQSGRRGKRRASRR
jgi:hypothetical protein